MCTRAPMSVNSSRCFPVPEFREGLVLANHGFSGTYPHDLPWNAHMTSADPRPALEHTQSPLQWVSGVYFSRSKYGRVVKPLAYLLVPRSRISGAIPPLPHASSWRGSNHQGQFYFTFIHFNFRAFSNSRIDGPLRLTKEVSFVDHSVSLESVCVWRIVGRWGRLLARSCARPETTRWIFYGCNTRRRQSWLRCRKLSPCKFNAFVHNRCGYLYGKKLSQKVYI
jgi:hypothetical protein